MVSIPAPRGGRRYEFMVLPGEDPQEMLARETVRSVLSRFRTVPDEDILRAVVYTFHARVAERFNIGRIALLGDAAHLSPPFAGQGMNAGLRDAFNVAWKVKLALDGIAPPHILDTYEHERKAPVTEMIEYAVALGEIVMPVGGLDEAAKRRIQASLLSDQKYIWRCRLPARQTGGLLWCGLAPAGGQRCRQRPDWTPYPSVRG